MILCKESYFYVLFVFSFFLDVVHSLALQALSLALFLLLQMNVLICIHLTQTAAMLLITYFNTTISFVSLPLAAIVPLLILCCCFLGIRSPQSSFCARVTFYIFTAIIGSVLYVAMLSVTLVSFPVIRAFNSTASYT